MVYGLSSYENMDRKIDSMYFLASSAIPSFYPKRVCYVPS